MCTAHVCYNTPVAELLHTLLVICKLHQTGSVQHTGSQQKSSDGHAYYMMESASESLAPNAVQLAEVKRMRETLHLKRCRLCPTCSLQRLHCNLMQESL